MTITLPKSYSLPDKIKWIFPHSKIKNKDSCSLPISSRSMRSIAKKSHSHLEKNNIIFEIKKLTQEDYSEWLSLYKKMTTELHYSLIADESWFEKQSSKNCKLWMISFRKDKKLIGGSIIVEITGVEISHTFKASKRLVLLGASNMSIGVLLEIEFLKFAYSSTAPLILSGKSVSVFGSDRNISYINFKLKMGYKPSTLYADNYLKKVIISNPEKPNLFFVKNKNDETFIVFYPDENAHDKELMTYVERISLKKLDFKDLILNLSPSTIIA